jgi:hypothetical protein
MTEEHNFVRKNNAIVNNDRQAFLAAKLRKKKEDRINNLEKKVGELEINVRQLTHQINKLLDQDK